MNIKPRIVRYPVFLVFISILFLASCSSTRNVLNHPTTSATLWVQNAAEYQALTRTVYRTAAQNLGMALEDSYWTASVNQKNQEIYNLPPAIIVDVDETVLDNSAFQARMIEQKSSYDPEQWNEWVMEAKADPVPGALEFTRLAAEQDVTVFYLTNREASVEEGTRENLRALGFPLAEDRDVILSKDERSDWTSAKVNRRAFVEKDYRVLMLFGDDLNDFISAKDISLEERGQIVENHTDKWGVRWFILPNPVYGSWEQALHNFDNSLSESEINEIKRTMLDTKNN